MPLKYRNARLNLAQDLVSAWAERNFAPSRLGYHALLGIAEEVGELCHAHLKQLQGIRGTTKEHEVSARDAIGDILIYLCDYCAQRGFNIQMILDETLTTVLQRDWQTNKQDGHVASINSSTD